MNGRSDTGEIFTQTDFAERAQLRDQPRPQPLHVLGGQPRPAVLAAGQQRHHLRYVQQRGAGRVGLHEVHDAVRRRHAAHDASRPRPPTTAPPGTCTAAAWVAATAYNGGAAGLLRRSPVDREVVDAGRHPGQQRPGRLDRQRRVQWRRRTTPRRHRLRPSHTPDADADAHADPTGTGTGTLGGQPRVRASATWSRYGGHTYKCLQAHTSQVGWEPPNVPALWQLIS